MSYNKRKCKYCKEWYNPTHSLQNNCEIGECRKKHIERNTIKNKSKESKSFAKTKSKDSLTLPMLKQISKSCFQAFIRFRDTHDKCISCGGSGNMHAGHYFKAELFSGVIFHEDNVNAQCEHCNIRLEGNLLSYKQGLIKKIGLERFEILSELANKTRVHKYTREDYEKIISNYRAKLRDIKK